MVQQFTQFIQYAQHIIIGPEDAGEFVKFYLSYSTGQVFYIPYLGAGNLRKQRADGIAERYHFVVIFVQRKLGTFQTFIMKDGFFKK